MAQHAKISIAQHCLTQHSLSRCDRFLPTSSLKMLKFHFNSRRVPYYNNLHKHTETYKYILFESGHDCLRTSSYLNSML
jgi:hypothetical protein